MIQTVTLEEEIEAIGKEILKAQRQLDNLQGKAPTNGSIDAGDMLASIEARKEEEGLKNSLEQVISSLKTQYEAKREKLVERRQLERKEGAKRELEKAEARLLAINEEFSQLAQRQRELVNEASSINEQYLSAAKLAYETKPVYPEQGKQIGWFVANFLNSYYLSPSIRKNDTFISGINNFIWEINATKLFP